MCEKDMTNNCNNCLSDIIEVIIKLQKRSENTGLCDAGCDKPFLGPTPVVCGYNTRPVTLFRCCDGGAWSLPYGDNLTSNVCRCENLDGCCLTCQLLAPAPTPGIATYVTTGQFFTINLNCVGALECLSDTYVDGV